MNPCYSGFQVQGTANSPAGMTPSDARNVPFNHGIIYYNRFNKKMQVLSALILINNEAAANVYNLAGYE